MWVKTKLQFFGARYVYKWTMYKFIGHKNISDDFYRLLCMCMFSTNLGSQRTRFADVLQFIETGV